MPRAGQLGVVVVGMPEEDTLKPPHRPVPQNGERTTAVRGAELRAVWLPRRRATRCPRRRSQARRDLDQ